jgi:Right handed beta helix region
MKKIGGHLRSIRPFIYSLVLTSGVLSATLSEAATYYVAKTGSNNNTCSQAQNGATPKLTINAAMACMSGGDTVLIGAGTYVEMINNGQGTNIPSGTSTARTTIKAKDGFGSVIIKPTAQPAALGIVNRHWILVQDLVVDSINQGPDQHHAVALSSNTFTDTTNVELRNVEARNAGGAGFQMQGGFHKCINCWSHDNGRNGRTGFSTCGNGIYLQSTETLVEDSLIENNGKPGYCSAAISGLDPAQGRTAVNVIVRNNILRGNGQYAISTRSARMKIYNNLIHDNGFDTPPSATILLAGADVVYNNTIVGNKGKCIEGSTATIRNNICYGNTTNTITGSGTISNNLFTDPKFVNTTAKDFRLQSTSPAINVGMNLAPTVVNDYDQVARPQGAGYDIGAYEFKQIQLAGPTNLHLVSVN